MYNLQIGHILTVPCLKFLAHALFYLLFLGLVLGYAFEMQYEATFNRTLSYLYETEYQQYLALREAQNDDLLGPDFSVRQTFPTFTQFIMIGWVAGFVMQECQHVYRMGFQAFRRSLYNVLDFSYLLGYITTFTLIGLNLVKVYQGLAYLREVNPQTADINEAGEHLYWMNADRFDWWPWDPINIAEGIFSFANVIAFSRLSYILAANEALGPMHISLARMVKDVLNFLVVFVLVFSAFLLGINNLYWYYSVRGNIEVVERINTTRAEENFGSIIKTFRTMFWSMFGRGEPTAVAVDSFNNHVTEDLGYLLYGVYNVACVTVLLNMLIAMMARSFELIAEDADVEWKYARSVLYMEYIEQGAVLPVPLNLLKAPKALLYEFYKMCVRNCRSEEDEDVEQPTTSAKRMQNGKENAGFSNDADVKNSTPVKASTSTPVKGSNYTPSRKPGKGVPSMTTGPRANVTYQKVMQRIIRRYIFEIQREEEVTEDDFEEVKQEISSFRYELLDLIRSGELPTGGGSPDVDVKISDLEKIILSLRADVQQALQPHSAGNRSKASHFPAFPKQGVFSHSEMSRQIPEVEDGQEDREKEETFDNNIKT